MWRMLKTVSKETEREENKFRRNWFCETMSKRITDFDRFNMPTNHLMHIQNEIRGRERIFRFFFGVCVMFVWFFWRWIHRYGFPKSKFSDGRHRKITDSPSDLLNKCMWRLENKQTSKQKIHWFYMSTMCVRVIGMTSCKSVLTY